MSDFVPLEKINSHLARMGIKMRSRLRAVAKPKAILKAQDKIGLELPSSYVDFVTTVCNGFLIEWSSGEGIFASFSMEPLESSAKGLLAMRKWRFYDDAEAKAYGFPGVKNPELAFQTNQQMRNWLPLFAEGNGDNVSINLNPTGYGNVVFDQHDWLDGGTGANGFLMATDITTFLRGWAEHCFGFPKSLWWKSVLNESGVDWNSPEFDHRFTLSS